MQDPRSVTRCRLDPQVTAAQKNRVTDPNLTLILMISVGSNSLKNEVLMVICFDVTSDSFGSTGRFQEVGIYELYDGDIVGSVILCAGAPGSDILDFVMLCPGVPNCGQNRCQGESVGPTFTRVCTRSEWLARMTCLPGRMSRRLLACFRCMFRVKQELQFITTMQTSSGDEVLQLIDLLGLVNSVAKTTSLGRRASDEDRQLPLHVV